MSNQTIKVGIVGATGYMGGEVLRVLMNHPHVEIAWLCSRKGKDIAEFHPNLYGCNLPGLIRPADISPCDLAFVALPTQASIEMSDQLLNSACRVIDLGAAFRLNDRADWERVYGLPHSHWHRAEQAVYGINELHVEEIVDAQLVANPGCFASAAILALAPLVAHDLVDTNHLSVTGISGTAGAGAELSRAAHHPEIGNNLVPYNVVDHRHSYEMEQELGLLNRSGRELKVHFTPVYAPLVRGLLNVCHAYSLSSCQRDDLLALYNDYYGQHEFVKVFDAPFESSVSWQYKPYPWVSAVNGSNYCYIGMDVDQKRGRLVLFSVLDSLGKGGAQVGIENMNIMFGLDRDAGLKQRALHP